MCKKAMRVLSLVLCTLMLLTLLPQFRLPAAAETAPAVESITDSVPDETASGELSDQMQTELVSVQTDNATVVAEGTCGDNAQWKLDVFGTLSIIGSGEMYDYDDIPWEPYREEIQTVVIHSGITGICTQAF